MAKEDFPCTYPFLNNNMPSIHAQKCLCGSFGIKIEDCETHLYSKILESHFEKIVTHPDGWPTGHDPGYKPRTQLCTSENSYASV